MKKIFFTFLLMSTFSAYVLFVQLHASDVAGVPAAFDSKKPAADISPSPVTTPLPATYPTQPVQQTPVVQTTPAPTRITTPTPPQGQYRNGTFTGSSADAYYGYVQVQAVIQGGKIIDVQFLDYPQDRGNSIAINNYATPRLASEAIQAQSANVNVISGATATSDAFRQSLASALAKAKT